MYHLFVQSDKVNAGGLVNHYYLHECSRGEWENDQKVTSNIKLVMPNPAHVNISAAGIAKSAKNKTEAIQFVEFISSPKGSRLIADPTFEYPLKSLGTSKELKAFGTFVPDNVSISALGATQKTAIKVMAMLAGVELKSSTIKKKFKIQLLLIMTLI